jgi:hypothetical protein
MNTKGDNMTRVAGQVGGGHDTEQPLHFLDRLEGLAEELSGHGLVTRVINPGGRVPSLHVVNPLMSRLAEDVYVGRSQDGMWWFWWPWAERIARGDDLSAAADVIARVLCMRDQ